MCIGNTTRADRGKEESDAGLSSPCSMLSRMRKLLPESALHLFGRIGALGDEMGIRVYLVGGLPRDLWLGVPGYDADVVVEGDGLAFARTLAGEVGGSVTVHKRFGTAIVGLRPGQKVDVATARSEQYAHPGALPDVEPDTIHQDLYRRDFTINSMAIRLNRPRYGHLVDPFGGRRDLKAGVLRVLHDRSFEDDPTRILRGVRFEQRYGFQMVNRTIHLLAAAVEDRMLDRITGQRLRDELVLILKEEDPGPASLRLQELGVLKAIWAPFGTKKPIASGREFGKIRQALQWHQKIRPEATLESWIVYLLGLVSPLSPDERSGLADRLCLHRRACLCISGLSMWEKTVQPRLAQSGEIRPSEIYGLLRRLPGEVTLFATASAEDERVHQRVRQYIEHLQDVSPSITGRDLQQIGVPEGPALGRILDEIRAAKLDGELESREEELERARTMADRERGRGDAVTR